MSGAFLEFSLRFYALPGVADACLALQDRDGADVNMLLFALWRAANGARLTAADLAVADEAAGYWRENVVWPLRTARRALKAVPAGSDAGDATTLRGMVKAAELRAEFLQQSAMERTAPSTPAAGPDPDAARENLARYAAFLGRTLDAGQLQRLLDAFA